MWRGAEGRNEEERFKRINEEGEGMEKCGRETQRRKNGEVAEVRR
jgi:hypothetical protein